MRFRRLGLLGLMILLTAAATYAGLRLAGVGGAEIGAVSGVTVSAIGAAGRRWVDERENRSQQRRRVFLPPFADDVTEEAPPAAMLVAERAVVPFIGREEELADLIAWCTQAVGAPLRLLIGAGGTGKTRLARELTSRLRGWDCVWVRGGEEAAAIQAARPSRALIIVDYAETRPQENMARLLWELAWPPDRRGRPSLIVARGVRGQSDDPAAELRKRSVRVLLIARAKGDWWGNLHEAPTIRERHIITNAENPMKLEVVENQSQNFLQHFTDASIAFAAKLGIPHIPADVIKIQLDAPILVIHIAALAVLLGSSGLPTGRQDELLAELLGHEDRYLQRSAQSCGLSWLRRGGRRQSVAQLCLTGADTVTELTELLANVPELAGPDPARRREVARWLQGLYPGEGGDTLSSLRPHLLSERLAVGQLADDPQFAHAALDNLPEHRTRHALTVMGFAAHHDERAHDIILSALEQAPDRILLPAVYASVETGVPLDSALDEYVCTLPMGALQLARLSAAIPLESQSLSQTAASARKRFIEEGKPWLRRMKENATGRKEIEQRQKVLLELSRITEFYRHEEDNPAAQLQPDLVKALRLQRKALTRVGDLQAAEMVFTAIGQIEGRRPPDH